MATKIAVVTPKGNNGNRQGAAVVKGFRIQGTVNIRRKRRTRRHA